MTLDTEHEERGVYLLEGDLSIDGDALPAGPDGRAEAGLSADLRSTEGAIAMLLGGAPLDGPRFIEWNFVSSSREKIEAAKHRVERTAHGPRARRNRIHSVAAAAPRNNPPEA